MKKRVLALALGVMALQMSAAINIAKNPTSIDATVTTMLDKHGVSHNVIEIVITGLKDFTKFSIEFLEDGITAIIKGETDRVRGLFDKLEKDEFGNHYRYAFKKIIKLPTQVAKRFWDKNKRYRKNSKYLKFDGETLTITVPAV